MPAYPFRTPRLVFRNLGDGRFEELIEEAGSRRGGDAHQPRLRVRRLRQRRRRRRPGDEHERAAVAAAQRRLGQRPLVEGAARRASNRTAAPSAPASLPSYGGRTQAQEVSAQSSFYSANDRRLHFGLGEATTADLTIRWPNWGDRERSPASKPITSWSFARDRESSGARSSAPEHRNVRGIAVRCDSSVGRTINTSPEHGTET